MPLRSVAFSPDNLSLATGGDFRALHTWDANNGAAVESFQGHEARVGAIAYTPGGDIVAGSEDQSASLWEANPGWILERTIGAVDDPSKLVNRVLTLDFSRDGTLLATGGGQPSRSGEIKTWKVADGSLVSAIADAHTDTVFGVRFSSDGKFLASGGAVY